MIATVDRSGYMGGCGISNVGVFLGIAKQGVIKMATLALTEDEVVEVRLHIGVWVSTGLLSDIQIRSGSVLGTATDTVFSKVTEGITEDSLTELVDAGTLTQAEADAFGLSRDAVETDIANFLNMALRPPQVSQFRRSVIFYAAGLCVPLVEQVIREDGAGVVTERKIGRDAETLFGLADNQIEMLRSVFPKDVFLKQRTPYRLFAIS